MLLSKHEVQIISKNFPNIWRRIQNKSFHNLVSIKNLTFKILKQYYNTHLSNKNNRDKSINLNLDVTKNSLLDNSLAFKQSLIGAKVTVNKDKSVNLNLDVTRNSVNDNSNIMKQSFRSCSIIKKREEC